jgi:hypothetical protein
MAKWKMYLVIIEKLSSKCCRKKHVATSSATARISALAFLLYDAKVRQTGNVLASNYTAVRHRIVHQRMANMSWNGDPDHTLSGVANYIIALNGW